MSNERPNINALGSYGVVDASRLLGIDRRTLRRYEAAGLVASHLNRLGRRRYTGAALIKLWTMFF